MEKIKIGKVVNAVGLKGEVKVFNYSGSKDRFESLKTVYIGSAALEIEKVRYVKNTPVLKLAGVDDRNGAEGLKGEDVCICESDLPVLTEGEYFIRDMIGLSVYDEKGDLLGVLCDVIQNKGQDLYEIETGCGSKILIPAVEEFITGIDISVKRIDVKLIDGLV
jgi:16S rRNA processing protein RimM